MNIKNRIKIIKETHSVGLYFVVVTVVAVVVQFRELGYGSSLMIFFVVFSHCKCPSREMFVAAYAS